MVRCIRCGLENRDLRYCSGCGSIIVKEEKEKKSASVKRMKGDFSSLAISVIDNIFSSNVSDVESKIVFRKTSIDISEMANKKGVYIVGNKKWRKTAPSTSFLMYVADMLIPLLLSVFFASGSFAYFYTSLISSLKIYFATYFFFSFAVWFIFPLVFCSTPIASIYKDYYLVRGGSDNAVPSAASIFSLWLYIFIFSFFPLFFMEILIFYIRGKKSIPFPFQMTGFLYMKKCRR